LAQYNSTAPSWQARRCFAEEECGFASPSRLAESKELCRVSHFAFKFPQQWVDEPGEEGSIYWIELPGAPKKGAALSDFPKSTGEKDLAGSAVRR